MSILNYFASPIVYTATFSFYWGLMMGVWGSHKDATKFQSIVAGLSIIALFIHILGVSIVMVGVSLGWVSNPH